MSQVTEQSVRFQTALASIKLIQASAVLDLTEDDFDFLTSNKVWIRSEERFSRNAETDIVCRLLLEKKNRSRCRCRSSSNLNLIFLLFFNDTATTEIYTLSLHDALPILIGKKS